ncbi:MAG TPA: tetratricopeptide repeat protein [Allosphingosinicella sp.]|jgi:tetratricopeptide (TPR) repeat protein
MNNRSVSTRGGINRSIVVTGDGNTASLHFGSDFVLPLVRKQIPPLRRRPLSADNPLPLLAADADSFPHLGRANLITELREWLETPVDVSVQGIVARAGTGKTRLAVELCKAVDGGRQPGRDGWIAGFLRPSDLASAAEQLATRAYDQAHPTLLVIDYAAAVHRELARWLDRLASVEFNGKLRFLLLDREAPEGFGWWHDLTRPVDSSNRADLFLASERPHRLPDLGDGEERRLLFEAAFAAASKLMGEKAPGYAPPAVGEIPAFDTALADMRFGNPLNLAMAGLIAVERGAIEAVALRRLEAARHLARRECNRMQRLGESRGISNAVMCHALAFNGLAGGLPIETLRSDLTAELAAASLVADAAVASELLEQELTPEGRDVKAGAKPRLGTIQPDLLGEAVIIETLLAGPKGRVASAPAALQRAYALTGPRCAEALMRLIQDYGYALEDPRAAEDDRCVAGRVIALFHSLAAEIPDKEIERLETLVEAMPHQTTVLREAAAEQTMRLAALWKHASEAYRGEDEDVAIALKGKAAGWLNDLSNRLSDLGQHESSLLAMEEAVDLRRQMMVAHPERFKEALASSLNNLSGCLIEVGQRKMALAAAEETVEIRRALSKNRPDGWQAPLAASLYNLARCLGYVGRPQHALKAIREALTLVRPLAAAQPEVFLSKLSMYLGNYSNRLGQLGRHSEARAAAQEAVDLDSSLAAAHPDAFNPSLAGSLNNLAVHLANCGGRQKEALEVAQKATQLYRELSAARPDIFTPDLARSLSVLGDRLEDCGNLQEAVQADMEAIGRFASYFLAQPRAFASAMQAYLADHIRRCQAAAIEPDWILIDPINEQLAALK